MAEKPAPKLNLMVFHRNFVMTTKSGRSIEFRKDEPVHVPPMCMAEAIAIGARMADGTDVENLPAEPKPITAPSDPEIRAKEIVKAFKTIVAKNDREDFMASGTPTSAAVSREVGFKVPNKEVSQVWSTEREKASIPETEST